MPRVPYFNGSVSSRVQPMGYVPQQPNTSEMSDSIGDSISGMAERYFGRKQAAAREAAEQELARQRAAAAAVDEQKVQQGQDADSARSGLSSTLDELNYRSGRGAPSDPNVGTGPVQIAAPAPYDGPAATPMTPDEEQAKLRTLGSAAAGTALGAGGNVKQISPVLQAFLMTNGDDAGIVRANAALEGKYLGEDQSPSLQRQDAIREDKQQHDTNKNDADLRMKKYGFDLESGDRRYNTNVDAGTARRGQDASAGTARRSQDLEHGDRVRGQDMGDARAREAGGYTQTTTTTKDPGQPASNPNFVQRMFGAEQKAARNPSTTKTTVRRPTGAGGGRPPLSAFGN